MVIVCREKTFNQDKMIFLITLKLQGVSVKLILFEEESAYSIMAKVLDFGLKMNEFELQSFYNNQFQINTIGKGMYPLNPASYDLNCITAVFLQG